MKRAKEIIKIGVSGFALSSMILLGCGEMEPAKQIVDSNNAKKLDVKQADGSEKMMTQASMAFTRGQVVTNSEDGSFVVDIVIAKSDLKGFDSKNLETLVFNAELKISEEVGSVNYRATAKNLGVSNSADGVYEADIQCITGDCLTLAVNVRNSLLKEFSSNTSVANYLMSAMKADDKEAANVTGLTTKNAKPLGIVTLDVEEPAPIDTFFKAAYGAVKNGLIEGVRIESPEKDQSTDQTVAEEQEKARSEFQIETKTGTTDQGTLEGVKASDFTEPAVDQGTLEGVEVAGESQATGNMSLEAGKPIE